MNDTKYAGNKRGFKRKRKPNRNMEQKKRRNEAEYEYGNYNRYYGYRNILNRSDPRLEVLGTRKELFANKDVLDIGCNIGHVTYSIARDFEPKSVLGIDLDNWLITIARKNLAHYGTSGVENLLHSFNFEEKTNMSAFPNNVTFKHENYVVCNDNQLKFDEPRYDVILCLSVTKWIHLNWGDDAVKRTFKRVFIQLRPGGVFVLEAQPYNSYLKKKLSARLRENGRKVVFYPDMFNEYLISEVGFAKCETLEVSTPTNGFRRPLTLFFKL